MIKHKNLSIFICGKCSSRSTIETWHARANCSSHIELNVRLEQCFDISGQKIRSLSLSFICPKCEKVVDISEIYPKKIEGSWC